MQFQGNDGSRIDIPRRVVHRRPSDDSVQPKLGGSQAAAAPEEEEVRQRACAGSPSSSGSPRRPSPSSSSSSSSPPLTSLQDDDEQLSSSFPAHDAAIGSNKRMRLEDNQDGTCSDDEGMPAVGDNDGTAACMDDKLDRKFEAASSPADRCEQDGVVDNSRDSGPAPSCTSAASRPANSADISTCIATSTADAATISTSSSSSSSSSWRANGTKPKRPMTAYNHFFREQRNLIKSMGLESYKAMMEGRRKGSSSSSSSSSNNEVDPSEGGSTTTSSCGSGCSSSNEDTSTTTTTSTSTATTTDPPSHQVKDTTKPPLQVMAKTVAHYWKRVPSADLLRYQELARQEQKRYRSEMKEYKAMLRDQQAQRQMRQQQQQQQQQHQLLSGAGANAANSVAGNAAAWGQMGAAGYASNTTANTAPSSAWTPEQMASIFGYLNQAQMEQLPSADSIDGNQQQQLILNAQNAMIGQLQDQIRSLQQTSRNNPNHSMGADISNTGTNSINTGQAVMSSPTAKGKPPSSSRGMLGRLEAQASLMRLQIERGKAMDLGASNPTGQSLAEGMTGDDASNFSAVFPNATMQGHQSFPAGDNYDASLGSASGAAMSLLASTSPPDNGDVFTQPPTDSTQASLPTPNLGPVQGYPPLAQLSSDPDPPQGWTSANALNAMPSVQIGGTLPQECPMPTQMTAGLPLQQQQQQQQQQQLTAVPSISGISAGTGTGQQVQYQSQESSISALSDYRSNFESADDASSNSNGLDAFSIAQMLFGPDSGR